MGWGCRAVEGRPFGTEPVVFTGRGLSGVRAGGGTRGGRERGAGGREQIAGEGSGSRGTGADRGGMGAGRLLGLGGLRGPELVQCGLRFCPGMVGLLAGWGDTLGIIVDNILF